MSESSKDWEQYVKFYLNRINILPVAGYLLGPVAGSFKD